MRGGVSKALSIFNFRGSSSPHARGCFPRHRDTGPRGSVFPACAGVFPVANVSIGIGIGLPRMRGGVSRMRRQNLEKLTSSPHARGCFAIQKQSICISRVFPACAGVFPPELSTLIQSGSLPRMRGGVSTQQDLR